MTEAFLHYIWQYQYFDKKDLLSTEGENINILKTGFYNTHAGPDFTEAKIKVGNLEWAGNVEIHIYASDWQLHKHQQNKAYDNVILHVVWDNDKVIMRSDGSTVPTLELKNRVQQSILLKYQKLVNTADTIPCAGSLQKVDNLIRISALDRALLQRLETKANQLLESLSQNKHDWDETLYQQLGNNFGFKVNSEAFLQLTKNVPYKAIQKHADNKLQVEALLFGTAGFLEEPADDYALALHREYQLLSRKFQLREKALHKTQWRFLRLRPANFPSLRIAQFAAFLVEQHSLLSKILEATSVDELKKFFSIDQSPYWHQHYQFYKKSKKPVPALGNDAVENMIINTIVPTLAAYSLYKDETQWMDRAINLLTKLPPEKNQIIHQWRSLEWKASSAFDSQGLIELHNNFCNKRLCLQCSIGHSLIRSS